MIGRTLARYEILERLGAGGMGEVYRAHDRTLDRDVAIKVLPADFAADPDRLARFEREARLLASLNHAHIATIHGFQESDGVWFIAMEYVRRRTLADRLEAEGRLEVGEACGIAQQIAETLGVAHESGVVHRDLKPANVKVTADGQVKVLDFGLAKAIDSASEVDRAQAPTLTARAARAGDPGAPAGRSATRRRPPPPHRRRAELRHRAEADGVPACVPGPPPDRPLRGPIAASFPEARDAPSSHYPNLVTGRVTAVLLP